MQEFIQTSWHWLPWVGKELLPPKLWSPRRQIIPMGRRRSEMVTILVRCSKVVVNSLAGWLHPALGCQLHHPPAGWTNRQSPSSQHHFTVSENLCGKGKKKKQRKSCKYMKELCCSKTQSPWKSFFYRHVAHCTPYMIFNPWRNWAVGPWPLQLWKGEWINGWCPTRPSTNSTGAWETATSMGYLAKAELCCNFMI